MAIRRDVSSSTVDSQGSRWLVTQLEQIMTQLRARLCRLMAMGVKAMTYGRLRRGRCITVSGCSTR